MPVTPHVSVDVGGTFTDVVMLTADGVTTAKVPTTSDQSEGVIAGIEKTCQKADIPPTEIRSFAHAMTVSVNALLERDGARTALVTTAGFRDVLEIGRQTRSDLYDLFVERPDPLVPRRRRFEVDERTTVDGVEIPVDPVDIERLADRLEDVDSVAITLLHAYRDPENEATVAALLRDRLDVPISTSHEVLSTFREYERTSTTVVDAYIRPAIDSYLGRLGERARDMGIPEPRVMQSNGGIADVATVRNRAVTTVLSGPAAGVVGANDTAERALADCGHEGIVTFDMGGTSTDVSLVRDGEIVRTTDAEVGGIPIATPMVDIETVGAGGGSIAWVDDGGALRVGPESAGADPGPACYGRGGENPTVTDAAVVLGYIGADASLGGEVSLDSEAARGVLAEVAADAGLESPLEAAAGVYRVANANMTRAIRAVTVERGDDPREFGLVAFGGAGPMHAAALADRLDIDRVVVPLAGGVLSAYGLSAADERHDAVRTHRTPLDDAEPDRLESIYAELADDVSSEFDAAADPVVDRSANLRYVGQSFELGVAVDEPVTVTAVGELFHAVHERAYGYRMDDPIEIVTLGVSARVETESPPPRYSGSETAPRDTRIGYFDGEPLDMDVYARDHLAPQASIDGPAVLEDDESTAVVPPAWTGSILEDGTLELRRGEGR